MVKEEDFGDPEGSGGLRKGKVPSLALDPF